MNDYDDYMKNVDFSQYADHKVNERFIVGGKGTLYPLSCGIHMCPGGMAIHHVRRYWMIVAVYEGTGVIKCDGKEYEAGPGDAFILVPDRQIRYIASETDPWVYAWIGFGGVDAAELLERTAFAGHRLVAPNIGGRIVGALWKAAEESLAEKDRDCQRLIAASVLNRILLWLIRDAETSVAVKPKRLSDYSKIAAQLIELKYNEDISVGIIAEQVGLSRTYLATIFKRENGMTIVEYIRNYRIAQAKKLLLCTDLRIRQIAEQVGISDYAYFSRLFNQTTGYTPTEFRKIAGKKEFSGV